ncbi:MAG TPA: hypothetical protein VGH02_06645 [Rhizomicrobium sp.]|jgi:hypothetical protein
MIKHLAAIVAASSLLAACDAGCDIKTISDVSSPDKTMKAILFERDCGATTDFTSQVSILSATQRASGSKGNTFIADTNHGSTKNTTWGGPLVKLEWTGPRRLKVHYDSRARLFLKEKNVAGVNISYRPDI